MSRPPFAVRRAGGRFIWTAAWLAAAIAVMSAAPRPAWAQEGLPAEVRYDILRLELENAAKSGRHKDVLQTAEQLRKLGRKMPPETSFFEAEAFYALGAPAMAQQSLTTYLRSVGKSGKNYDRAIHLFVEIKAREKAKSEADEALKQLRENWEAAYGLWQSARLRSAAWRKNAVVFGGPGDDSADALARSPDGGFVVAGAFHVHKTDGDKPIDAVLPWLTAFDAKGRRVWHRPLGTSIDPGRLTSAVAIAGRGYLLGGRQKGFQIAAVADKLGNIVKNGEGDPWVMGFAPANADEAGLARLLNDGNFLALGAEDVALKGPTETKLRLPVAVLLSPKGKVLGKFAYGRGGGAAWFDVRDAVVLDSGDIIVTGESRTDQNDPATGETFVLRIASSGKEIWLRRVPPSLPGSASPAALAATADGGVIVVGADSGAVSYFKMAGDGKLVWRHLHGNDNDRPPALVALCKERDLKSALEKAYDGHKQTPAGRALPGALKPFRAWACAAGQPYSRATGILARPGGYLILGVAGHENGKSSRIILLAIGDNGAVTWESRLGEGPASIARAALPTNDGGFVVTGTTTSWRRDVLLFKADRKGEIGPFTDLGAPEPGAAKAKAPVAQSKAKSDGGKAGATEAHPSPPAASAAKAGDGKAGRAAARDEPDESDLFDLFGVWFGGKSQSQPDK